MPILSAGTERALAGSGRGLRHPVVGICAIGHRVYGKVQSRLSGVGHSPYCLVPRHLSGIWSRNRVVCPPQIVTVNRVVVHKYGFDYERAIGRRVMILYAAITH